MMQQKLLVRLRGLMAQGIIKPIQGKKSLSDRWAERYSINAFLPDDKKFEEINITDLPIMIAQDGSLVCIPRRHEPFNAAAVGKKGTGKSLILHRIVDEIFWLWSQNVIIMNDIQGEDIIWNSPMNNNLWIRNLSALKEKPIALPIVFIYPHTNQLELNYEKTKQQINYIQTTIPFSEVIDNSAIYLNLGNTAMYVRGMKDELLECETPDEIEALLLEKFPGKSYGAMRNKIMAGFYDIFKQEILNITNKEYPYKIKIGNTSGNPLVILTKFGIVPCFETYDLATRLYAEQVFSYHLESIFSAKQDGGLLENETVYIYFDELTHVCTDADKNSAYESLSKITTRGRKMKLGLLYATQNYSKIPRKIKSNTDYVFAFQHSNEEEVNRIVKDYDMHKLDKKEILNLNDFEVMAITNEHFVVYRDGKRLEVGHPIKGTILPPLSNHFKPQ